MMTLLVLFIAICMFKFFRSPQFYQNLFLGCRHILIDISFPYSAFSAFSPHSPPNCHLHHVTHTFSMCTLTPSDKAGHQKWTAHSVELTLWAQHFIQLNHTDLTIPPAAKTAKQ